MEYTRKIHTLELFPELNSHLIQLLNRLTCQGMHRKVAHQQQIRLAVNKPGIMHRTLYYPSLNIFIRVLPLTYKSIFAAEGTLLQFTVTGEAGGNRFWPEKKRNGTR